MGEWGWTKQLDGTWKNGVWCMVWCPDDGSVPVLAKVIKWDNYYSHDGWSEDHFYTDDEFYYEFAEPVEERHAKLLETIHRKESEALKK